MSKKMIEVGGIYIHAYSVGAITDHLLHGQIISNQCEVWCGSKDGPFVLPLSKEEAARLINDSLEKDEI